MSDRSDRSSETEAPPLDVNQELCNDEGYIGWEVRC